MQRLLALAHRIPPWALPLLIGLLIGGGAITLTVDDNDPDTPPQKIEVKIPPILKAQVESPQGPVTIEVPTKLAEKVAEDNTHADLRDESPPGMSDDEVDSQHEAVEDSAAKDNLPPVSPLAAPTQPGCATKLVSNFSSRGGVAPRQIWMHYTVSRNLPGWTDVNAIVGLFNRPSFQASSSYVYDFEGNCAYIVREVDKPWTQAAGNPWAISFEIIAMGSEPRFVTGKPLTKLGGIIKDIGRRWDIPLVQGRVNSDCSPGKAGIVQHADGGACAGGHHDIGPFALAPIVRAAQRAYTPACRAIHRQRKAQGRLGPTARQRARNVRAAGLKCVKGHVRQR